MTQNWIGGSALDWIHQHVVLHHIFPNDAQHDPDIVGADFLRLNPLTPLIGGIVTFQYIYVFILFAFFGISYILTSFQHLVTGFHFTYMSELVKTNRLFEEDTIAFFLFPLVCYSIISTSIVEYSVECVTNVDDGWLLSRIFFHYFA
jgi:hypothetical protein